VFVFPPGIITRELLVGPAYDLDSGVPYSIRVLVESSRILVMDGTPVLPKLTVYDIPAGEQLAIELPVCDQPGYTDSKGNLIDAAPGRFSHYYRIATFYLLGQSVANKDPQMKVAISSDDLSPIDIDDLIYFQGGKPAEIIYVPDSWSEIVQEAQEAADSIPQLVDDTIESWLVEHDLPDTRTDLNTLGWPEFIILEHDVDSSSVPNGSFIVRLPEGWTP
jgi:hypothetical protein